jgi:hypothetical protein
MRLVRRRRDHTVNAGFQKAVGQELQDIRDVDGYAAGVGPDVFPLTGGGEDL